MKVPQRQRYLRGAGLVSPTSIPIERSERLVGDSKYRFAKLLGLAFDGVFAFFSRAVTGGNSFQRLARLFSRTIRFQPPQGFGIRPLLTAKGLSH
jgi:hypothetical protein